MGVRVDHVALGVEPADFLILCLREREDEPDLVIVVGILLGEGTHPVVK